MIRARGKGYMVGPNVCPVIPWLLCVATSASYNLGISRMALRFGCMVLHPQGAAVSERCTTWLDDALLGAIPPYVVVCTGFACTAVLLYPLHYLWIGRNVPSWTDGFRHQ